MILEKELKSVKRNKKMKALIVTVAGMSARFSRSAGEQIIKCLYHTNSMKESLLYTLLNDSSDIDYFIIVGGYRYEELCKTVREYFEKFSNKILMVENPYYKRYGSGYSLYIGLQKAFETEADEILFAEGDLHLSTNDYKKVCNAKKSVVTVNRDPILADKAVALYFDTSDKIHYIYDTEHNVLTINEPFLAIYNSGQVWKFADKNLTEKIYSQMEQEEWHGTNLVFVEKYFTTLKRDEYELITFNNWINCNTIDDYNKIQER